MTFVKYQHVERFGTDEVVDIDLGTCLVFPKLDGSNGSVWMEDGQVRCASRNRVLTIEEDHAGFAKYVAENQNIRELCIGNPDLRFFGEWLVKHTVNYTDDAYRHFYIFDVMRSDGSMVPYGEYINILILHGVKYVAPMAILDSPSVDQLMELVVQNKLYLKYEDAIGEGIVIKRYDFMNKYGRTPFAKLLSGQFIQAKGKSAANHSLDIIEEEIVEQYITQHLVDKTVAKITEMHDGFKSEYIPQLLGTVYHDLITEEMWDIVKVHKNPRIDFRKLQSFCYKKTKEIFFNTVPCPKQ